MSLFNYFVSKTIMHVPGALVGYFARNYIAGETLQEAVGVAKDLNSRGVMATIDILGEFIQSMDDARFFTDQCLEILEAIDRRKLEANLSLKPTQLGLLLDPQAAFENIRRIVARAADLNNFVRLDMEDRHCTDATLDLFRRLRVPYKGSLGTVLQAYLRRTMRDIDGLSDGYLNIRICKGIYNEPWQAAYKDPELINRNYVLCLQKLLEQGAYVGIATHDEKLIFEALHLIRALGLKRGQYEFQMLLGVREGLRDMLVAEGHRVRVYVPYGKSWLPYARRRLRENPVIARHALRQLLGIGPDRAGRRSSGPALHRPAA